MYCKHCGKQIPDDSNFCSYCGGKLGDGIVGSTSGSRAAAYLPNGRFFNTRLREVIDRYASEESAIYLKFVVNSSVKSDIDFIGRGVSILVESGYIEIHTPESSFVAHEDCSEMFKGCSKLRSIDFGDSFDASKVKSVEDIFTDCPLLVTLFPKKNLYTVNGVTFEMILVEGGTFIMGATSEQGSDAYSYEKPTHQVTLSDFSIGKTEVTQALWKAVMGSNPSYFKGDNLPVEYVSWDGCQEFIKKLNKLTGGNFRLPTEAEWEYAARGGNKSKGYKYSGSNDVGEVAWYYENSNDQTHPVATKSPNELGLYDMSGNVWERCQDWYGDYSSEPQTNPKGPNSGTYRVIRGGSWFRSARDARVSFRRTPSRTAYGLGLRLVSSDL